MVFDQETHHSVSTAEEEVRRFVYPIAFPLRRVPNSTHTEVLGTLRLFMESMESFISFLAAIAIAEYRKYGIRNVHIDGTIGKLNKASLGQTVTVW